VKVLVVSHLYPAPGDERSLFVEDQVKALTTLGVGIRVMSPTGFAPRALWIAPRLRRRGLRPTHAVRAGIPVEYPRVLVLPKLLLASRSGAIFYASLRRSLPALRSWGLDLVHAHQALPDGAAARRLAADLGVPYVVTVHGRDVYHNLRSGGALARATALALREASAVVAVSSAVARALENVVAPERLFVNLNGFRGTGGAHDGLEAKRTATAGRRVITRALPAVIPDGASVVLTAGTLIARKGHDTVLRALARLPERERPHYLVAGDGPLLGDLRETAREAGIDGQVHLLGWRPHAEVLALMKAVDLFLLPSRDEAFGLVYAEAMSQGTPVIGCRGEGLEDFVEDGVSGFVVDPGDDLALAALIACLLQEPATAAGVGEAGKAAVAGLTWQANAERQIDIYRRVLGEGRA
jgi:teichuronic acid biosynthesis glycosyltransferase TuaC